MNAYFVYESFSRLHQNGRAISFFSLSQPIFRVVKFGKTEAISFKKQKLAVG